MLTHVSREVFRKTYNSQILVDAKKKFRIFLLTLFFELLFNEEAGQLELLQSQECELNIR